MQFPIAIKVTASAFPLAGSPLLSGNDALFFRLFFTLLKENNRVRGSHNFCVQFGFGVIYSDQIHISGFYVMLTPQKIQCFLRGFFFVVKELFYNADS